MEIDQNYDDEDDSEISFTELTPNTKMEESYDDEESYYENEFCLREILITNGNESEANNCDQEIDPITIGDNDSDDDDDTTQSQTTDPYIEEMVTESPETNNLTENRLSPSFQIICDGRFYILRSHIGRTVVASCSLCEPRRDVKGNIYTTYNFKLHLKRIHGDAVLNELNKALEKCPRLWRKRRKRRRINQTSATKNDDNEDDDDDDETSSKQSKLNNIIKKFSRVNQIIFNGKFFKLKSKNKQSVVGTCMLCNPHFDVKGTVGSSSNFRSHLIWKHDESVVDELNKSISLTKPPPRPPMKKVVIRKKEEDEGEKEEKIFYTPTFDKSLLKDLSPTHQILFDGKYFIFKSKTDKWIIATCIICKPHMDVRGLTGSNFKAHLRRKHDKSILNEVIERISLERARLLAKNEESKEFQVNSLISSSTICEDYKENDEICVEEEKIVSKSSPSINCNYEEFIKNLSKENRILFDGTYFEFRGNINSNKIVTCKVCQPNKDVRGNSSTHFRKHLQKMHGDAIVEELNEYIALKKAQLEENVNATKEESKEFQVNSLISSSTICEDYNEKIEICSEEEEEEIVPSINTNYEEFIKKLSIENRILFDGKYFEYRGNINSNKIVTCKTCQPNKDIRGNSSTHFRRHLQKKHGDAIIEELNEYISLRKAQLEKTNNEEEEIQTNLLSSTTTITSNAIIKISQTEDDVEVSLDEIITPFQNKVMNYFLRSFTPLSAVDTPEFWTMFDAQMPCISEDYLVNIIQMKFNMLRSKITALLEGVEYVCTTTDLWSSRSQYYLAITCHWIDVVNFKRRSVALACKRFDTLTYNENHTDALLMETLYNYNLPLDKIVSNVTRNCYNFSEIFKDLNISTKTKMDDINENYTVPFQTRELSSYNSYTSTLCNIATIDVPNVISSDPALWLINELTLKKVFTFLSLASSCPTLSTMLADLKKPDVGKWNSIYDAIAYVLKLEQKCSIAGLFDMINLEPFTDEEVKYLREYVKCLHPLAIALERLQSEQGTYQGFVLPTILVMRKNCEQLQKNNNITLCKPILKAIVSNSMKRFNEYFTPSPQSERVTIASLSHPFFKEKWISAIDALQRNNARVLFVDAVQSENSKSNSVAIELEALSYLNYDRKDLQMLNDYPAVKRVFLKYNTALSSAEPFEKLFPCETRQYITRYDILADDLFEERVLLSVNKDEIVL